MHGPPSESEAAAPADTGSGGGKREPWQVLHRDPYRGAALRTRSDGVIAWGFFGRKDGAGTRVAPRARRGR
jgi:hypothetical protein